MTAFRPVPAPRALELVAAGGVPDPAHLISDHAAARLVKSYALVITTTEVGGSSASVRGSAIPVELWQRIIGEGVVADVWTGGTVRLAPSDLRSGAPAVSISGIGFREACLRHLIDHHRGQPPQAKQVASPATVRAPIATAKPASRRKRAKPDPEAIPPGAILATVAQTQAALGLGRTKVNELMNDGRLVRRKVDGGTRIEVASILVLAGFDEVRRS